MNEAPIRVLELVSGLAIEATSGGVARFVTELAQVIDRTRVEVSIAALWDYGTSHEQTRIGHLAASGIPALLAAPWDEAHQYQSCVAAFRGLWRKLPGKFEIIHGHGEFSDLAAIGLAPKLRARHIVRTVHNEIEWSKRPLFGKLFPNLVYPWFFAADLAVSKRAAENLDRRPLARLLRRRALYAPNALNFSRVTETVVDRTAKRTGLGLSPDAYLIGSVGRLTRQKGYDILLAAAPRILARCPTARFVIVGAGPLLDPLREQARALGIAERVLLTGARPDAIEILKTFDLFVSPSRYEGLPTVVLEAIAAGLPVVATRVSGNTELVEDGVSGALTAPEDPEALARAVIAAAADPVRAVTMAQLALERAEQRFSMAAVAERYADLYCALARGSAPRGAR